MNKICNTCGISQPEENYHWNRSVGGRFSKCKSCRNKVNDSYYQRNKERINAAGKVRRDQRKEINYKYLIEYFANHPCIDCGEKDFRVLHFDHRDGTDKFCNIGNWMPTKDWDTILSEILKCDVRCANCHLRKTAIQLNWYAWARGKDILPGY